MLNLARTVPLAVAFVLAASAAPAAAFVASSGPQGLDLDGAGGDRAEVTLALVNRDGAPRYRVEVPRPHVGQNKMSAGSGCVKESPDVAICDRVTPQVKVALGVVADTFTADPDFPDPITISGGQGKDVLRPRCGQRCRGGCRRRGLRRGRRRHDGRGGRRRDRLRGDARRPRQRHDDRPQRLQHAAR
jgi:hypothetical protein